MNPVLRVPGIHPIGMVHRVGMHRYAGFAGIFGDIMTVLRELVQRADDVIVAIGLPKAAALPEGLIASPGCGAFDGLQDSLQTAAWRRNHQQVDVIGHYTFSDDSANNRQSKKIH